MKHISKLVFVSVFLIAGSVFAQDPGWHKVPDDALDKSRAEIIRKILNSTNEAELLEIVSPSTEGNARLQIKIFAYKRLGMYGTKAAVPVLVSKLEVANEGFYARYALETIPDQEVDAELCKITESVK
ncbi:MAG: hypothetical protein LBK06_05840, partial [Planctomycetaceae bacterium]|nr:hypothetical protein [Planctomycetaceae bacterium]